MKKTFFENLQRQVKNANFLEAKLALILTMVQTIFFGGTFHFKENILFWQVLWAVFAIKTNVPKVAINLGHTIAKENFFFSQC